VLLLLAIGGIIWEAIRRINHPVNVNGEYVIIVAAIGVVINGITAFLFLSGRKEDLNIRGAFLHMAADALMSIGVVISGIAIIFTGFRLIDPIVSLIISAIILSSTWSLLKESVSMAMDSVPQHIDIKKVVEHLKSMEEIEEVHDIHIWNMSTSEVALTAHVVRNDIKNNDALLNQLISSLHEKFGIFHVTIQFEKDKNFCKYKEICKIEMGAAK
jgi:cobalt-zinc-cadmium efflux system protein